MGRRPTTWMVLALAAAVSAGSTGCEAGCDCADVSGLDLAWLADAPDADGPGDAAASDEAPVPSDLPPDAPADTPPDAPADVPTADPAPDVPPADARPADLPPEVAVPEFLGGDRPAALFVPDDYDARRAWPLLILLHGYSASGFLQDAYLQLSGRVTEKGFVFLRPDGTLNSKGLLFWNASSACCDFDHQDVDDVAYLSGLIDEARATLNIDPDRVYLLGHSNGGFMSLRMACDASDRVSGILSIAGSIARQTVESAGCTPARPVSVVLVHGTDDTDIRYGGAGGYQGLYAYVGAEETRDLWKALDGCTGDPATGATTDFDDDAAGAETTPAGWSACSQGTSVSLWTLAGSGHIPAFNEAGREALLDAVLGLRRDPAAR